MQNFGRDQHALAGVKRVRNDRIAELDKFGQPAGRLIERVGCGDRIGQRMGALKHSVGNVENQALVASGRCR